MESAGTSASSLALSKQLSAFSSLTTSQIFEKGYCEELTVGFQHQAPRRQAVKD